MAGVALQIVRAPCRPDAPQCPGCAGTVRPSVVLFGEQLGDREIHRYSKEIEHTGHGAETLQGFDVVLSIGTTSVFPYISGPVVGAARRGATTVEINPSTTPVSEIVDFRLTGPAAEVLDTLDGMLAGEETSQSKL